MPETRGNRLTVSEREDDGSLRFESLSDELLDSSEDTHQRVLAVGLTQGKREYQLLP